MHSALERSRASSSNVMFAARLPESLEPDFDEIILSHMPPGEIDRQTYLQEI